MITDTNIILLTPKAYMEQLPQKNRAKFTILLIWLLFTNDSRERHHHGRESLRNYQNRARVSIHYAWGVERVLKGLNEEGKVLATDNDL